jgi:predicted ATPase
MVLDAPPGEPWLGVLAEILPELRAAFPDVPVPRQLDAAESHSRLLEAIARTIERLARVRPLLMVLEDVHWAQPATLHALEAIGARIGGVPAVLVATYRSGELAAGNELTALRRRLQLQRLATAMELHSLRDRDVAELVQKTAGVADDDGHVSASVFACSEGNPLFAALLLRTYAENGALPAPGVAPPGIADIVLARTNGLDAAARTMLETAAVAGRSFSSGVLADALGWKESDVLDALGTLLDRGLVRTAGSSAFSYAFTHALIEASMYSSVEAKERIARHRRMATVLSTSADDERQALPSIARHWKLAGDGARAAQTYLAAARAALEVYARDEAIDLASEALALEDDPARRFDVLRVIVDSEEHHAPVERWNDDLTLLAAAAEGLGDEARFAALEARARYCAQTGERERERALIAQMLALAERMRSSDRIVDALGALGNVYVGLGDFRAAVEEFERALALAAALGDRRRTSYARQRLILTLMRIGDVATASQQLEIARAERTGDEPIAERMDMLWAESSVGTAKEDPAILERVGNELMELARKIGDRETEAKAHWLLGWAALVAGDAAGVRREYGSAATLFEQLEQPQSLAATYINLGVHYFEIGLVAQAIDCYERAAACAEQTRARNLVAFATTNIGDAELARGNVAKAREMGARGLEIASPTADQRCIAGALSVLGGIECACGDADAGIGHLRAAVEIRRGLLNTDSLMEDLCRLADALCNLGDARAASEAAAELETLLAAANPRRTPPRFYATLAKIARLCGNPGRAQEFQMRARSIFDAQLAALPDEESRAAFAALPHHRELATPV